MAKLMTFACFLSFVISILLLPNILLAQTSMPDAGGAGGGNIPTSEETTYEPLAPLPGLEGGVTITEYFTTMYQIGVSLVLLIAVVMFIVGGIQYMTSDSIGGKGGGRDRITKALIGILLAVGSYLLLFLIGGGESVKLSFNLPDVGYVPPVTPQPGPLPPEGIYCQIGFTVIDNNDPRGKTDLVDCPSDFQDRFWRSAQGTFDIESEEELLSLYEASGYSFPSQCKMIMSPTDTKRAIVEINMDQCTAIVGDKFDKGTPQECFVSLYDEGGSRSDALNLCNPLTNTNYPERLIFKVPLGAQANFDDPGACYQVDDEFDALLNEVTLACDVAGGRVRNMGTEGLFCVAEATEQYCTELEEGEFMSLSAFDDEAWDEFLCNTDNIDSSVLTEQEIEDFLGLYEQFSNQMGLGHQNSGYYYDDEYTSGSSPDGHPHCGIDINTNYTAGTPIKAPISGLVVSLWGEDEGGYTDNGKIGIIDEQGKLWTFTHVMDFQHVGGYVEAGTVIAESGDPSPGGPHLHLEVHNDADLAYNNGSPRSPYTGLRSGLHSGTYEDTNAIANNTMCPLQAYWESINAIGS